jgi:hypothetical protein
VVRAVCGAPYMGSNFKKYFKYYIDLNTRTYKWRFERRSELKLE